MSLQADYREGWNRDWGGEVGRQAPEGPERHRQPGQFRYVNCGDFTGAEVNTKFLLRSVLAKEARPADMNGKDLMLLVESLLRVIHIMGGMEIVCAASLPIGADWTSSRSIMPAIAITHHGTCCNFLIVVASRKVKYGPFTWHAYAAVSRNRNAIDW